MQFLVALGATTASGPFWPHHTQAEQPDLEVALKAVQDKVLLMSAN